MHFPQAMEILEGDGSDASVSTITMSKVMGLSEFLWGTFSEENSGEDVAQQKKGALFG